MARKSMTKKMLKKKSKSSKKCAMCHKKKCTCSMMFGRRSFGRRSFGRRSFGRRSFGLGRRSAFGSSGEFGPGFDDGQNSFPNSSVNYFGSKEPFIVPSEFYLPVSNGQYQITESLQTPMSM